MGLGPALALLEGEAHLGLGGEGAEGEGGLEPVDRLHRIRLVAGEAGEEGLLLLAKGEGVAEEGEGVVFGVHRICLVHLRTYDQTPRRQHLVSLFLNYF